jgi:two-component system, chemotaxis family, protein-glutamate methylesterase/glutaminase
VAATEQPRRPPARTAAELAAPGEHIDVVVIGASAGGLEALTRVMGALSPSFDAAIFIVLHIAATGTSALAPILNRASPLPVSEASEGERIDLGHVYVAPSNRHLELERGVMHVTRGPQENGHRPAIDPLFRTAARAYGPRAAGVILSGTLDDGTAGLREVHELGGVALVQDPDTALYPGMPSSAMRHVDVDAVLPLDELAPALMRLADRAPAPGARPRAAAPAEALEPTELERSRFTCPDCGGPLAEYREAGVKRFRCVVGHAYSLESLFGSQAHQLEAALWAAVRLLEDRVALLRRMGAAIGSGKTRAFEAQAQEVAERAQLIRAALERGVAAPRLIDDVDDVASS